MGSEKQICPTAKLNLLDLTITLFNSPVKSDKITAVKEKKSMSFESL